MQLTITIDTGNEAFLRLAYAEISYVLKQAILKIATNDMIDTPGTVALMDSNGNTIGAIEATS